MTQNLKGGISRTSTIGDLEIGDAHGAVLAVTCVEHRPGSGARRFALHMPRVPTAT
jgi:hypothetical protein